MAGALEEVGRFESRSSLVLTFFSGELINGKYRCAGFRALAEGGRGELRRNNRRPCPLANGVDGVLSYNGNLASQASGKLGTAYLRFFRS